MKYCLIVGLFQCLLGFALWGWGVPISANTTDTLLTGTVLVCSGTILLGLSIVASEMKRRLQ